MKKLLKVFLLPLMVLLSLGACDTNYPSEQDPTVLREDNTELDYDESEAADTNLERRNVEIIGGEKEMPKEVIEDTIQR